MRLYAFAESLSTRFTIFLIGTWCAVDSAILLYSPGVVKTIPTVAEPSYTEEMSVLHITENRGRGPWRGQSTLRR